MAPQPKHYWLGGIGAGLIALHLSLTWQLLKQPDQIMLSLLLWGAIVSQVWQRRHSLIRHRDPWATLLGLGLAALLLCKSLSLFWFESAFVRLFPGLAALSWALLVSGFRLEHYRREGWIVLALMVPQGLLAQIIHRQMGSYVQVLIAQVAAFCLHYGGIDVMRQGSEVLLGHRAIAVEFGCTGIPMLIVLLQLAVMLLVVFPVSRLRQLGLISMAIVTALGLSSLRVVVMALVVDHPTRFDYWHGVQGSQVFTTLAIALLMLGHHLWIDCESAEHRHDEREFAGRADPTLSHMQEADHSS